MSERPATPPEGELITAALKRRQISARAAARQAGISDARWRQITSGFQTVSGTRVAVRAPAETLARMAQVAGLTPEQLSEVGRADAAEALRQLTADSPAPAPQGEDPREARIRAMEYLTDAEKSFYIEQLRLAEQQARQRSEENRREAERRRA